MAQGGKDQITARIALEGGQQIKQELAALGAAGEKAFAQIKNASENSSGGLSRVGAAFSSMFASLRQGSEATKAAVASTGELSSAMGELGAKMGLPIGEAGKLI